MNHLTNVQLGVLSLVILITGMMLMHMINEIRERGRKSREAQAEARRAEHEAREERQKRDHQLNHGRMIYNWLADCLKEYKAFGVVISKMEDNGGGFSIFISDAGAGTPNLPLLQITYNFVKYPAPYLGHIHYAKYGADIHFWVGDQAPKAGLDELVLENVRQYVARHPERLAKAS